MCGIAGFSLTPSSKVKPRQLANALLTAIEDRGYMASGYAYQVKNFMGYYKQPVTGSMLSLKGMPKDARHVILHTRLATHGSVEDNRNNHPVMSPSGDIALVHNGVIYNHTQVRLKIDADLPDVDTSVIPAVIEQLGVDSLDVLDGDAAVAWFNRREHNTLHLARYHYSPLAMCQIEDGSFIFASTEELLWRVLIQLDLMPTWMELAKELDYFTIRDGVVLSSSKLPAPQYSGSAYDYNYFRHQTSGAKGMVEPSYREGWGWDDWEDWDTYSYYERKLTNSCSVPQSLDVDDVYDAEVVSMDSYRPSLRERQAKWFTQIQDERTNETFTLYYMDGEVETWKNELYLLADEGSLIVDYGRVASGGHLLSAAEEIF